MDHSHALGTGKKSLNTLVGTVVSVLFLSMLQTGPVWSDDVHINSSISGHGARLLSQDTEKSNHLVGARDFVTRHAHGKNTADQASPPWREALLSRLMAVDADYPGEIGVFIKDLQSGHSLSFRGEESWYLASGVKIPVAITVMRAIERGQLTLDTHLNLIEADLVDGAGPTKWQPVGTEFSVRHLLDQMLISSDNTASDLLIRAVGLEQVNHVMRELVPEGLGDVTTLADVRRHAYSGFHHNAFNLSGHDFLVLRNQETESGRIQALAKLMDVPAIDFNKADMDSAFAAYYATDLNGGELSAFAVLLEKLANGEALNPDSTAYLMGVLGRVETGEQRIKAGLPGTVRFAHKTGTQHGRACDLGVAVQDAIKDTHSLVQKALVQGTHIMSRHLATRHLATRHLADQIGNEIQDTHNEIQDTHGHAAQNHAVTQDVAKDTHVVPIRVVIAVCSRGNRSLERSELAFRQVGEALKEVGFFRL